MNYDKECKDEKVCDYLEWTAQNNGQGIGDYEIWLVDTDVNEESQCLVLENTTKNKDIYILCLYNDQ